MSKKRYVQNINGPERPPINQIHVGMAMSGADGGAKRRDPAPILHQGDDGGPPGPCAHGIRGLKVGT